MYISINTHTYICTHAQQVRKHYRRMVLQLHPDKNAHVRAKDAFTAVQQAFEHLSSIQASFSRKDKK